MKKEQAQFLYKTQKNLLFEGDLTKKLDPSISNEIAKSKFKNKMVDGGLNENSQKIVFDNSLQAL